MKLRDAAIEGVCLTGVGCIVAAGFMVYTPLGLVLLGCPLVGVALYLRTKK